MILVVCLVAAWLFREPLGTLAGTYYQIFGVRIAHAWLLRSVLILANVIVAVLLTVFGA